jgi:hypothetical protein
MNVSWDELWARSARFRRIWRTCTVIWGTALLADAVARVLMAVTLPVGAPPALGGIRWPGDAVERAAAIGSARAAARNLHPPPVPQRAWRRRDLDIRRAVTKR